MKKRVLSIDGGGIKGVLAAEFLATVEEATNRRIADYFDLVAGTSTGGIIALGLGLGMSAREIVNFYVDHGPSIFEQVREEKAGSLLSRFAMRSAGATRNMQQLLWPKYDPAKLRSSLESVIGQRVLGDSRLRLVIPAYHADKEDLYVFKTRHHERLRVDWKETMVDVALATAAAPTYFRAHSLPSGSPIIDGGVWANNPTGVAAVEARTVLNWRDDELFVLSLGCTEELIDIPLNSGYKDLLFKSTALFMQGQSRGSMGTAYLLSNHSEVSPRVFRYQPKVVSGKFSLDKTSMIDRLRGLGSACARDALPMLMQNFLDAPADPFVPIAHG
ncbi:CBASS cGAMP-activated phospholipase [Burkholderia vietnamiensis]|uniref:CBASS cGAMP-activated phospholipase n=1 Tax=Burkholderia vietnamiensis TaxID=60552 RepID=UPI001CC447C8|nr:CBASS cGAMP-activated phospholipase [Burkholderia vietnamiensis]